MTKIILGHFQIHQKAWFIEKDGKAICLRPHSSSETSEPILNAESLGKRIAHYKLQPEQISALIKAMNEASLLHVIVPPLIGPAENSETHRIEFSNHDSSMLVNQLLDFQKAAFLAAYEQAMTQRKFFSIGISEQTYHEHAKKVFKAIDESVAANEGRPVEAIPFGMRAVQNTHSRLEQFELTTDDLTRPLLSNYDG
jgi:hypothetical protein